MKMNILLINMICLIFQCVVSSNNPIVKTANGKVQGFLALNETVDVFFGIPFAQPPIGDLRFEKPKPVQNWEGILQANQFKNGCYSHASPDWLNSFLQSGTPSEDCLYLNILSPHQKAKSPYPVLFIIHGGGYEMGSALSFSNFTDIGTNFVQYGIVVVSIQYRLGELGFATTGDDVLPGNLGLFDQYAALEWVKMNIEYYGGDQNQITIIGQSAGSASASALALSPYSRNLFQRIIQMSGSSLSSWVYGSRVKNETLNLARMLDCPMQNSKTIKECLKAKKPEKLLKKVDEMGQTRSEPNPILFSPHFDGDFFPEDPAQLIKKVPTKQTIIGFNQLEWLIMTLLLGQNSSLSHQMLPASAIGTYNANDFANYINTKVAYPQRFGAENAANVGQRIFDFYNKNSSLQNKNSIFYIHQYMKLLSDLMFTLPIVQEIEQKVQNGWPIFMYIFKYFNAAGFPATFPIKESYHINDYNYVFFNPFITYSFNEIDYKMQAFIQEAFRNFIKTGNPSTTKASIPLKWPRVKNAMELNHLEIMAPSPILRQNARTFMERLKFWNQLANEFPQYNVLREIPKYC